MYNVRVDLQKFSSGAGLLTEWHADAQAATQAIDAGAIQVWIDAAGTTVYAIINMEADNAAQAHAEVLNIMGSLPMGASGYLIIDEARVVTPYPEWAEYLPSRG